MEKDIKKLTNSIDGECEKLINDNKLLINGFEMRLNKRILSIFNKYNIPFNKEKLKNTMREYLINSFRDSSFEVCNSYKKILYKYFDLINEYYHNNKNSKDKIKNATTIFINKIYNKENPILNDKLSANFIAEMKNQTFVYDNNNLNIDLNNRIKNDTIEVIKEINKNNNKYVVNSMKIILEYVLK